MRTLLLCLLCNPVGGTPVGVAPGATWSLTCSDGTARSGAAPFEVDVVPGTRCSLDLVVDSPFTLTAQPSREPLPSPLESELAQCEEALREANERLSEEWHSRRMSEAATPCEASPSLPPAAPSPPLAPSPSVPVACPCIDAYPPGIASDGTTLTVGILGESFSYPPTYGLGCGAHDAGLQPYCATSVNNTFSPLENPRWCSNSWCYVNVSDCNVDFVEGDYQIGADLVYSYAT